MMSRRVRTSGSSRPRIVGKNSATVGWIGSISASTRQGASACIKRADDLDDLVACHPERRRPEEPIGVGVDEQLDQPGGLAVEHRPGVLAHRERRHQHPFAGLAGLSFAHRRPGRAADR